MEEERDVKTEIENYLKKADFYMSEAIVIMKEITAKQEMSIRMLAEKMGVELED